MRNLFLVVLLVQALALVGCRPPAPANQAGESTEGQPKPSEGNNPGLGSRIQ